MPGGPLSAAHDSMAPTANTSTSSGWSTMRTVGFGLVGATVLCVLRFLVSLFRVRKRMLQLRAQGMPMPPYNPVFGHLLFCQKVLSRLPKDAHPQYLPDRIRHALPELGPDFYLDTWPFAPVMLVVSSPSTLHQITQERSLPKYHALRDFLYPLTGGLDIVTMEGQTWKTWRSVFNLGFSNSHLMTLVPDIITETSVFVRILEEYAVTDKIMCMKDHTDNLTIDVVGKVVLDARLNSQRSKNPMVDALRSQIRSLTFANVNPLVTYNPIRPVLQWYRSHKMNQALSPELEHRFKLHQRQGERPSKSVIDLALQNYLVTKSHPGTEHRMNATFRKFALSQIKLFLFSGHDTTSSSICYVLYLLSIHGDARGRVRREHREVLGSTLGEMMKRLEKTPSLLNKLPFTHAVIKESLRLFPVVSSTREGEVGFYVKDAQGRNLPTEGYLVWAISQAVQRDSAYWPRANEFIPKRWLVGSDDPLFPVAGAWRPFELGPRNCIAQELAVIEMKIVLIMCLHVFDFHAAYDELDKTRPPSGPTTVEGERAYQVQLAQPRGGFPCRVRLREHSQVNVWDASSERIPLGRRRSPLW